MTVWGARVHLDPNPQKVCNNVQNVCLTTVRLYLLYLANAMYFAVDAHCFSYGMFKGMCEEISILCRMLQSRRKLSCPESVSSIQYNRCTSTMCGMKLNIDD